MAETGATFGPCCFCAQVIEPTGSDPCRLTVTTSSEKWQVWFCHGACFRERLGSVPEFEGLFDPAYF